MTADPGEPGDTVRFGSAREPRSRPGWLRSGAAIAVVMLAIGAAAGFAAGRLTAPGHSPQPGRHASVAAVPPQAGPALAATGGRCSRQRGRTLQLGAQFTNESDVTVRLRSVRPLLPLGGLRELSSQWTPCGYIAVPGAPPPAAELSPGQTGWLTVTFRVLVSCPGPMPVEFHLRYLASGKLATAVMDSFPDLTQVPYSGC